MGRPVAEEIHSIAALVQVDQRYHEDAYQFVREALSYAQEILKLPSGFIEETSADGDHHITGQQLCEAIRLYALEQFGFMAKTVLNCWGIYKTDDFGEIVYNLIRIKHMKKSDSDRREDFNDLFDFRTCFDPEFELSDCDEA